MTPGAERTRLYRIRKRVRDARTARETAAAKIPRAQEAATLIGHHLREALLELQLRKSPFGTGTHPDSVPLALVEWARRVVLADQQLRAHLMTIEGELASAETAAQAAGLNPDAI